MQGTKIVPEQSITLHKKRIVLEVGEETKLLAGMDFGFPKSEIRILFCWPPKAYASRN